MEELASSAGNVGRMFAFVVSQKPRVLAQHGGVAPVNIPQRVVYTETGATGQVVGHLGRSAASGRVT
jgi:chromosome partitioning protein